MVLGQPNFRWGEFACIMANENDASVNIEKIEQMLRDACANTEAVAATEEPFSMFCVPEHIRSYKNNKCYFEPRVVSIGPYHRNKEHLRAMELCKWRYLSTFIQNDDVTRKKYADKITALVPSIRKCYFESIKHLTNDELVEMLLLDGCFILQLMIKLFDQKNARDWTNDPVFGVTWNLPLILTDLLMLENQIPFFVLKDLYEIYSEPSQTSSSSAEPSQISKPSLDKLLLNFVQRVERRRKKEVAINFNNWLKHQGQGETPQQEFQVHHLLHLYHIAYIPVLELPKGSNLICRALSAISSISCLQVEISCSEEARLPDETHPLENNACESSGVTRPLCKASYPRTIPCARELKEFGITFKKHEQPKNFMDISFIRGVLKIPCISIEETTKPKYMNLVAFEQNIGMENKHMTSFAIFMDFLLNTGKDVIILQRDNILENKLANEDEVAEFFSQLHGCCYIRFDKHYLAPVFRDVKVYCEKLWPRHRARLCHDYFSNPWAVFSLGVALFVLSVTIFRTVCFIMSAFFHRHHLS